MHLFQLIIHAEVDTGTETVHFTACVVWGFLGLCPFVPLDMAKADSEIEFSLAKGPNEQNFLSDLNNQNLMFHLVFFLFAVTGSQWFGRGDQENGSHFLRTVSLHPLGSNLISAVFHKPGLTSLRG